MGRLIVAVIIILAIGGNSRNEFISTICQLITLVLIIGGPIYWIKYRKAKKKIKNRPLYDDNDSRGHGSSSSSYHGQYVHSSDIKAELDRSSGDGSGYINVGGHSISKGDAESMANNPYGFYDSDDF